ncbi:acetyltransferase [Umezawaea tangerina]|uniref:Sugar O-acyltransferase (Sialic acid O-acetyltransferase NeuD family) n=1 Tax=Umezawaea tangerina TaxID=84725 RepID=A0A2T0T4Y4_9PSEU|nr:acetyltransferase [Umezawaea tangerina]PRY40727.1 sugar O-acyltransferase (sialic acid O-acetyltransferase NeuD family) [Umezawaea tangerina]
MSAARPLLLVGAGGLARECLAALAAVAEVGADPYTVLGFLDDDPARHGTLVDGTPVLGGSELVHEYPDTAVLICTAGSRALDSRPRIARRLGLPDERLATLVHPAASVAQGTEIGAGTILLAGAVVTAPQRIGRLVVAMPQVLLTHDDEVDEGVTMAGRVALAGGVRVGWCAYLGAGSLVRENVTVGELSLLGMGSVLLEDLPAGQTWVGSPARQLARRPKAVSR